MRIKIEGYGIQTFAGIVPFAAYEYFESEGIDLEDYENSLTGDPEESSLNIPKEYHFAGEYGALNNIADLWEVQGALLDEGNTLIVEINDNGDDDWECDCSLSTLESHGIKLFEVGDSEDIIYELHSPTAILIGTQVLEGLIFGEEFEANSDFDPKQLEIHYHNNGDDLIVKSIQYAGQELHNTWLDVEVESNEYEWITK